MKWTFDQAIIQNTSGICSHTFLDYIIMCPFVYIDVEKSSPWLPKNKVTLALPKAPEFRTIFQEQTFGALSY